MNSTPLSPIPSLANRVKSNGLNDEESNFKTPIMKRLKGKNSSLTLGSPAFEIPPSPCLKQLGFGTGYIPI